MKRGTRNPPISIVIPLYNKAAFIQRALDSVLKQTVSDYEVIVIDDGSLDEGPEIVSGYKDRRIRLIRQENQGVSAARNRGIDEAKGELIAFLDADDAWKPTYLHTILTLKQRWPEAGAYATAYEVVMPNGKIFRPPYRAIPRPPWEGLIDRYFRAAADYTPVSSSSTAIPRHIFRIVGAFAAGVPLGEDMDMWGRIALRFPIAFSTTAGAMYFQEDQHRHSGQNLYFCTIPEAAFVQSARRAMEAGETGTTNLKDLRDYLAILQINLGRDCCINGQDQVAARKILRKSRPVRLRTAWQKYKTMGRSFLHSATAGIRTKTAP